MAFGNASLPTRKYVYGCREFVPRAPAAAPEERAKRGRAPRFDGHDAAVDQLRAAHRFQNKLVEIERQRRERADAIIHAAFPDLAELLTAAGAADAAVAAARDRLAQAHSAARERGSDPALAHEVRALEAARRAAWAAHRARKREAYAESVVAAALRESDERAAGEAAAARTDAVAKGLYWATSLIVAQRVKKSGPPPRFKPWTGEGLIAVQFQRKPDKSSPKVPVLDARGNPVVRRGKPVTRHEAGGSLSTGAVFTPNTLCWLEPVEGRPRNALVHFRVGSVSDGAPVWARVPATVHRPLPRDAEVKWAYLSRRRVGTRHEWEVHFDVAAPADRWRDHDAEVDDRRRAGSPVASGRSASGTVAVALGWRLIGGAVRVAVWAGSDGATGEVTVPRERVSDWLYCDHLRSVRDHQFNADRCALADWLAGRDLPGDWPQRVAHLGQWRSPARLASLVLWWRHNRLPDDEAIYERMEGVLVPPVDPDGRGHCTGGRRQDKHLYDWQEGVRERCRRWRKWFYRDAALKLAARYRDVVVADIDWHAIAENPLPEELEDPVNKTYRGVAACASLRDELTDVMYERRVAAPGITVTCHRCGLTCSPPGRGRWVSCERCGGGAMDRAVNAANNILHRALAEPAVA